MSPFEEGWSIYVWMSIILVIRYLNNKSINDGMSTIPVIRYLINQSTNSFKGTVVNRTLSSLLRGTLDITLSVSLRGLLKAKFKDYCSKFSNLCKLSYGHESFRNLSVRRNRKMHKKDFHEVYNLKRRQAA